ncbi:MAG: hypothetical protein JRE23_17455 [Deltaproteobacteria bacterium]|nr:hypothetical protein [Deltaproteobacteria bacterium]
MRQTLTIDSSEILKNELTPKTDPFRVWLTWQFNGAIFLDAGTRAGCSAKDFSYNPKNLVLTYDCRSLEGEKHRIADLPNVLDKTLDVNDIDPTWLSKVDVIFLDISHNGDDERLFLERIEPHFKGILVMDDVNCTERYPKLYELFNSLDREKHLLVPPIGASRGTGVVPYGDWTIEIKEK